jgi:hypothetical protein
MEMVGSVVAVYGDHNSAEAAVKKLLSQEAPLSAIVALAA